MSFEAENFFTPKTIESLLFLSSARHEGSNRHKIRCGDITCMYSADTGIILAKSFLYYLLEEELEVTIQVVAYRPRR